MNIILIGMMGSGKSTAGRILAEKLKWKFYDLDSIIESEQKMTVTEIFNQKGEAAFRELEKQALAKLTGQTNCVIATGGGAPTQDENWKSFGEKSAVVWLKSSPQVLFQRLEHGGNKTRPLIKDVFSLEKIFKILNEREMFYQRAQFAVETDGLNPEETVEKIMRLLPLNP